jgi:hypothetical protein
LSSVPPRTTSVTRRGKSHLVVVAVALGCHRAPMPPAQAPVPAPPAPSPAAVAVPPPSRCDRALAAHRTLLAGDEDAATAWEGAIATVGQCFETPGGAWVVALDALVRDEHPDGGGYVSYRGRWSVAHVAPNGATVRDTHETEWVSHDLLRVTGASTFDYDGDGEPELLLHWRGTRMEWADAPDGGVFTFRDGALRPYAPAADLHPDEARDVDGDGRPDLVTHLPYRAEGNDFISQFTYLMEPIALLAHALPDGTFSRDDETARAFARASCPRRVPAVFEGEPTREAVVCARLWGVPPAAVARAVRTRCASVAEMQTGDARRPHCGDVRVLLRWAAQAPAVTLP